MALDYLPSPSWAVIYGETPSATRWSELGENDDALATGAGIDSSAIINRHIAANAVAANQLATTAIFLGEVTRTSNFTTTSTTPVLITGMSLTVTVPAGGRKLLIIGSGSNMYYSVGGGAQYNKVELYKGVIGAGGTVIGRAQMNENSGGGQTPYTIIAVDTPAAGSQTYQLGLTAGSAGAGAGVEGASTFPIRILALII